jgi:hypothetical protein
MSVPTGFLRNSVLVSKRNDHVALRHSFWELELPKGWVDSVPELWEFLAHRVPAQQLVGNGNAELSGLLELLKQQGCLSFPADREQYSLSEVQELFVHLCAQWYREYYSHPLWQRLRNGSLGVNALVAWLIHNYHVSRSAGMSDARCAVRLPRPELRSRFAQNALEEYSHCDDFYFVNHPRLSISDNDVKSYIHLPSSLAFDHQMLRMAEDDWLGHVLVSFFQESTVRFLEDSKRFYQTVEEKYQLEGFFASWQQHIELDLQYGHASNFALILSAAHNVSKTDLLRSLKNARFTVDFLISALDEILSEDIRADRIFLRLPIRNALLDSDQTSILAPYAQHISFPRQLEAQQAEQLYNSLTEIGLASPHAYGKQSLSSDRDFLLSDLTISVYKALSYADEHDLIILFGRLAEDAMLTLESCSAEDLSRPPLPNSYRARALANFLSEQATKPELFAFLLLHLSEVDPDCTPVKNKGKSLLRRFFSTCQTTSASNSLYITRLIQLNEFYAQACSHSPAIKEIDFFFD